MRVKHPQAGESWAPRIKAFQVKACVDSHAEYVLKEGLKNNENTTIKR